MRMIIAVGLMLMLVVVGAAACDSAAETAGPSLSDAGFEETAVGTYTYMEPTSPLGEGGVKIEVTTGDTGTVKFIVTDAAGNETADFYTFTPADGQLLRHRYVAAMGAEYNYYFDIAAMELIKMTDGQGVDITEDVKGAGRWESAVTGTTEHAGLLITYFETTFGMTMAEVIAM